MNKIGIIIIALILGITTIQGQDILIKHNGEELNVKIVTVQLDIITYYKFTVPDAPLYSISKSDVFMIRYENGDKDIFLLTNNINKNNSRYTLLGGHIVAGTIANMFNPQIGVDLIRQSSNKYLGVKVGFDYSYLKYEYYNDRIPIHTIGLNLGLNIGNMNNKFSFYSYLGIKYNLSFIDNIDLGQFYLTIPVLIGVTGKLSNTTNFIAAFQSSIPLNDNEMNSLGFPLGLYIGFITHIK